MRVNEVIHIGIECLATSLLATPARYSVLTPLSPTVTHVLDLALNSKTNVDIL